MRSHLAAAGAALAVLWAGCSKQEAPPALSGDRVAGIPSGEDFESTLPRTGEAAGYTGSAACRSCHEQEHASWHRSYHRTMTQIASDESVQADFNDVVLETDTTRFKLSRRDGEYWVRMEPLAAPPPEAGPVPSLDRRVGLITGSHHMQVFWLPEGDGNIQLGFPFTWLIPEKRWVPRDSTFIRPPGLAHHAEVWNVVCSRCHTTGVEPHVNIATRSVRTAVAELGISCEACHGPGGRHVTAQNSAPAGSRTVAPGEIIQPRDLSAERSGQVCGFCHSMKWIDKSANWREHGFEYRPGDDLEQTTPVIRPSRVDAIPALQDYLAKNPDLLRDFFWPDGMVRVSGRELNGVIESPCYQGGRFSCLSCHSMHDSDPADQLAARAKGNGACTQCHDQFRTADAVTAHTRHAAGSAGSECYNCHMPHTTYGILKAIRSHQISSPSVRDDRASGRPNACNLCHLDKTLSWTAGHLSAWFGQPAPDLAGPETNLSHAVRLALSGDAGQRVLLAWHLSWSPALQASGSEWVTPVLAQLLDDPYAAIRCVAERSLKALAAMPDGVYDYTIDPRRRPAAREPLWNAWQINAAGRQFNRTDPAILLRGGAIDREQFEALRRSRNDRPLRLRE